MQTCTHVLVELSAKYVGGHKATQVLIVQSAKSLGLAGQPVTHLLVEGSIKKSPVQLLSHVLRLLLAKVPLGQTEIQVLLKAKREGEVGQVVFMQLIVVGSARKLAGQIYRHYEVFVLFA